MGRRWLNYWIFIDNLSINVNLLWWCLSRTISSSRSRFVVRPSAPHVSFDQTTCMEISRDNLDNSQPRSRLFYFFNVWSFNFNLSWPLHSSETTVTNIILLCFANSNLKCSLKQNVISLHCLKAWQKISWYIFSLTFYSE